MLGGGGAKKAGGGGGGGFGAMLGGGAAKPKVATPGSAAGFASTFPSASRGGGLGGWKPANAGETSTDWMDLIGKKKEERAADKKEAALADERRWVAQQASKLAAAVAMCAWQAAAGAAVEAAINSRHHTGVTPGVRSMPWMCRHLTAKKRVSKTAEELEAECKKRAADPLLNSIEPKHVFLRALQRPTELPNPSGFARCDAKNTTTLLVCRTCNAHRMSADKEAAFESKYAEDLAAYIAGWEAREAARQARIAKQQAASSRARARWLHAARMVRKGTLVTHPKRQKNNGDDVGRTEDMLRQRALDQAARAAREAAAARKREMEERLRREREEREAGKLRKMNDALKGAFGAQGQWVYGKARAAKAKEPNAARDVLGPLPPAGEQPWR
jgi:hypothetical protein